MNLYMHTCLFVHIIHIKLYIPCMLNTHTCVHRIQKNVCNVCKLHISCRDSYRQYIHDKLQQLDHRAGIVTFALSQCIFLEFKSLKWRRAEYQKFVLSSRIVKKPKELNCCTKWIWWLYRGGFTIRLKHMLHQIYIRIGNPNRLFKISFIFNGTCL